MSYEQNTSQEKGRSKGKKTIRTIADANTVYAYFDGSKVIKSCLFGDPGKNEENRFCQMNMIKFSEDGKTITTIMIEKKGKDIKAYSCG